MLYAGGCDTCYIQEFCGCDICYIQEVVIHVIQEVVIHVKCRGCDTC